MGVLDQSWILAQSAASWLLPLSLVIFLGLRLKGKIGPRPIGSMAVAMVFLPLAYLTFAIPFSINRWGLGFDTFERIWRGVIWVTIGTTPIVFVGVIFGLAAARCVKSLRPQ